MPRRRVHPRRATRPRIGKKTAWRCLERGGIRVRVPSAAERDSMDHGSTRPSATTASAASADSRRWLRKRRHGIGRRCTAAGNGRSAPARRTSGGCRPRSNPTYVPSAASEWRCRKQPLLLRPKTPRIRGGRCRRIGSAPTISGFGKTGTSPRGESTSSACRGFSHPLTLSRPCAAPCRRTLPERQQPIAA
jgi:hypothetical protein